MASVSALNTLISLGYSIDVPEWVCVLLVIFTVPTLCLSFVRLVCGLSQKEE